MKTLEFKYIVLFVLLTSIGFTSCSSEDDEVKNLAPSAFNLIEVADGATNIGLKPTFLWSAATDPENDTVSYNLYLGTNNPPATAVASNLSATTYSHQENLDFETTYYWKVIAKDDKGAQTESIVNTFTTQVAINSDVLIGKWLFENIEEGEDPLTDCEKNSFLEFYDATTGDSVIYADTFDGGCVPLITGNLTYELISENIIKFINADADASTYTSEILSVSDTELVLRDFAFIPGKIVFKKAP